MIKIRAVMDQHSPAIDQATLARFLTEGFSHHIKRMRKLYSDRRTFYRTIQQIARQLLHPRNPRSWITLVAWVRQKEHMPLITRGALTSVSGLRIVVVFYEVEPKPALTFGFAACRAHKFVRALASSPRRLILN